MLKNYGGLVHLITLCTGQEFCPTLSWWHFHPVLSCGNFHPVLRYTVLPKKNRTNLNHARKKSDIDFKHSSYWSTFIRTQLVKCSSTLNNNSKFCGDSREGPSHLGITIERPGTARPSVGRNFGPISKSMVLKNSEVILYRMTHFYWYRIKNIRLKNVGHIGEFPLFFIFFYFSGDTNKN